MSDYQQEVLDLEQQHSDPTDGPDLTWSMVKVDDNEPIGMYANEVPGFIARLDFQLHDRVFVGTWKDGVMSKQWFRFNGFRWAEDDRR